MNDARVGDESIPSSALDRGALVGALWCWYLLRVTSPLDFDRLWHRAQPLLAAVPSSASAIAHGLRVSHHDVARLLRLHREEVVVAGRARATRYALRRSIPGLGLRLPVFEVDALGQVRQCAVLHPSGERGFYVEPSCDDVEPGFHLDLPWFLDGLRPAGFLGRLVPRQHPELGLPDDIRLWSGDHTVRYASSVGYHAVGNVILGEPAREAYQRAALAAHVLDASPPGSSAAGEQPKFLARREDGVEVLVKFSPPRTEPVGRRLADLIVSEHVALEVLRGAGHDAALSSIVEAGDRLFLEVVRFDRTRVGRRGVVSLEAADAEFVGDLERGAWDRSVEGLAKLGKVQPEVVDEVRWLQTFGACIANSDMHPGNLSFFITGTRLLGLTPAYDMLPMHYAPLQGHLRSVQFRPPTPQNLAAWRQAAEAAARCWAILAEHPLVSVEFRSIARDNRSVVERMGASTVVG